MRQEIYASKFIRQNLYVKNLYVRRDWYFQNCF